MKALNAILVLALLAPVGLCAAPEVREEILVIVNNHIITRRDLAQAVEQQHAALYRQFSGKELDEKLKDAREKTLQGLVDAFLLEDKGAELGSPVTDDYVRASIDGIKKENNFATDADLERALRSSLGIGLPEIISISHDERLVGRPFCGLGLARDDFRGDVLERQPRDLVGGERPAVEAHVLITRLAHRLEIVAPAEVHRGVGADRVLRRERVELHLGFDGLAVDVDFYARRLARSVIGEEHMEPLVAKKRPLGRD